MHNLKMILDTTSYSFSLKATVLTFECPQKRNLGNFRHFLSAFDGHVTVIFTNFRLQTQAFGLGGA